MKISISQRRLLAAVGIAIFSTVLSLASRLALGGGAGDFSWALGMARDLLAGRQFYVFETTYPAIPYPLPVVFFGLPLLWLPEILAATLFFGLSTGLLSYGLLGSGSPWRLLMFFTPSFVYALAFTQWQPLLLAMLFFPALLCLVLIKPHMALPLMLSGYVRWTRGGLLLTAVLGLASLIVDPGWPWRWLPLLQAYQGLRPPLLTLPLGPLLLLALLRWRHREARLLLLLALMPQRMWYDQLALWLVPQSPWELLTLNLTSWVGTLIWLVAGDFHLAGGDWQLWILLSVYLPALVLVLRRQECVLPTRLEDKVRG